MKILYSYFTIALCAIIFLPTTITTQYIPAAINPNLKTAKFQCETSKTSDGLPVSTRVQGKGYVAPTPGITASNEIVVGTTNYDLQSNASMSRRLQNYCSGSFGATWTYCSEYNTVWGDTTTPIELDGDPSYCKT